MFARLMARRQVRPRARRWKRELTSAGQSLRAGREAGMMKEMLAGGRIE